MEEKTITISDLKKFLLDENPPDDFELWVPIWGSKTEPVTGIYMDKEDKKVNIMAEVA